MHGFCALGSLCFLAESWMRRLDHGDLKDAALFDV